MTFTPDTVARILDLEARQDEALRQLDELERSLDALLAQVLPPVAVLQMTGLPSQPAVH